MLKKNLLKENSLLRQFLNLKSTAYFLDQNFYHTRILLFSTTTSATIVMKAAKYSMYFIIHNSYDVATKYSIISTEKNVNLSYLIGSVYKNNVYFHMTGLLPKYWKLLPLSMSISLHESLASFFTKRPI